MRVRQSDLATFGACAMQWYYANVLEIGEEQVGSLTVLGTVFHYAVDVYENFGYNLDLAKRTFIHYWNNPEELGEKIDFWHRGSTFMGLQTRGLTMLEQYHELSPWNRGKRVGSEIHFIVPIGDHELEGTVDKLMVRNGMVEIVDFKTGARVPTALRYNIQFSAYCYATTRPEFWKSVPGYEDGHERFARYKRGGWWYHARNGKMFSAGHRDKTDYDRLLWAVTQMSEAVDKGVFPLTISGESCLYCSYQDVCGTEVDSGGA